MARIPSARRGGWGTRGGLVVVQPCRTESWGAAKALPGLGSRARYFCPGLVFPWLPRLLVPRCPISWSDSLRQAKMKCNKQIRQAEIAQLLLVSFNESPGLFTARDRSKSIEGVLMVSTEAHVSTVFRSEDKSTLEESRTSGTQLSFLSVPPRAARWWWLLSSSLVPDEGVALASESTTWEE